MLPLLRQCYESATGARTLASSIKKGDVSSLKLALSLTIDIALLVPYLIELAQAFRGLTLKLLRGTGKDITEILKEGEVELAIASTLDDDWERIDKWPLFEENYLLDDVVRRHFRILQAQYRGFHGRTCPAWPGPRRLLFHCAAAQNAGRARRFFAGQPLLTAAHCRGSARAHQHDALL